MGLVKTETEGVVESLSEFMTVIETAAKRPRGITKHDSE